jgi:SAM-dependent methyltransferase
MDVKEAELIRGDAADHWYYRNKARAVERLLEGRKSRCVLDVGAGSGFFSRHLLRRSLAEEAWCFDINYEHESDIVENGRNVHFRTRMPNAGADVVLLMDVLEHVDDDVGLLRASCEGAAPDATFLISVPAFQFMWSGHDEFLEHKRRYTLRGIEEVVRASGLHVQRGCYFYASIFPAAILVRLPRKLMSAVTKPASDLRSYSPQLNGMLNAMLGAELPFFRSNRLFGLTAFCLATREPSVRS